MCALQVFFQVIYLAQRHGAGAGNAAQYMHCLHQLCLEASHIRLAEDHNYTTSIPIPLVAERLLPDGWHWVPDQIIRLTGRLQIGEGPDRSVGGRGVHRAPTVLAALTRRGRTGLDLLTQVMCTGFNWAEVRCSAHTHNPLPCPALQCWGLLFAGQVLGWHLRSRRSFRACMMWQLR